MEREVLPRLALDRRADLRDAGPEPVLGRAGGEGHIHFPDYPVTFYANHYIHSFRMRDGLIEEYWEHMNPCNELRALGIEVPRIAKPAFG